jgi:hypothetical protein
MTLNLEEVTADEAYNRMKWCEEAVRHLKERLPREARIWWEKECKRPNWLESLPRAREKILRFAERLEQEMCHWAEAASTLHAEESRLTMERSLKWKRTDLEYVRRCQKIPEAERTKPQSDLYCRYVYLFEELKEVRKENSTVFEPDPNDLFKIGRTRRPLKKRENELWTRERLWPVTGYATVVHKELEDALHDHFDHFRVLRAERQKGQRRNAPGERFLLPKEEVECFKDTVAKVERWVLVATEARLELEIMKMGAALARMRQ